MGLSPCPRESDSTLGERGVTAELLVRAGNPLLPESSPCTEPFWIPRRIQVVSLFSRGTDEGRNRVTSIY